MGVSYRPVAGPANAGGIIQRDANGYAWMTVGAIGGYNSSGDYYEATQEVINIFSLSSMLQVLCDKRALVGEDGHPDLTGLTEPQANKRFATLLEANTSTHHDKIELDTNAWKRDGSGIKKGEIAIMSYLSPHGAKADVIERAMINPKVNLCYSIRAITRNRMVGRVMYRALVQALTFDNVYLPGISAANKFTSPALIAAAQESAAALDKAFESMEYELTTENVGDTILLMQGDPTMSTESIDYAISIFKELDLHQESAGQMPTTERSGLDIMKSTPWFHR